MKEETRGFYESCVCRAVELVRDGLDDALDLGALARTAALSPLHFHRVFKFMIGETPLELHRRLRLERAADALATTDLAVVRVAFDAGYETHESFTRAFAASYGLAPTAFRQRAREPATACSQPPRIELASRSGVHFRRGASAPFPLVFTPKGDIFMNVELKTMPALRVAAVRHVGPYDRISDAFARLGEIAGPAGLVRPPKTEMLAIYHDDPESTPVAELRSDAALTVDDDTKIPSGTSELRIAGGRYAVTTHVGPYTGLGDAWARFMGAWLPKSGHRVAEGPPFEIYRNNPTNTPKEKLVTELYLPIV